MYIQGVGEVKGIGPRTNIFTQGGFVRAKNLDDQMLSLTVRMLLTGAPLLVSIGDNRELRARLRKLNPLLIEQSSNDKEKGGS